MAEKDEELEPPVEIIEGDGVQIEAVVEAPGKPEAEPAKIVSGEEGAEELKRRLDDETKRREAAEAIARTATEQVGHAKAAVEDGELREIETSINVTKRNLELAKQQYRNARAASDVDGELEATEAIAQAKADLNSLEAGKAAREHAKKNPQPQQQQQIQGDPAELWAQSMQTTHPRSAQWIRDHAAISRSRPRSIRSASDLAIDAGLVPESDAYFAHIEGTLQANGILPMPNGSANGNGNGAIVKEESAMSEASRPVPPAAAPPSRSGSAPSGQKPGTIRLTREQAEMAEMSFPNLVKEKGAAAAHRAYAQAMVEARANGKIN